MIEIWTHQGDGIENTLQAFTNAWNKGITNFETDIQVTADGVLVLSHDSSIYRLTGVDRSISDITFNELQKYKIYGKSYWTRLDELIELYPDAQISIDMKTEKTLNHLVDFLLEIENFSNLVIGSFNSNRVKRFRQLLPNVRTALTIDEAIKFKLGMGLPSTNMNRYAMLPYRYANINIINSNFISKAANHQIPCHVWTVNEKNIMLKLIDLGVAGIITDDVDLAISCVHP